MVVVEVVELFLLLDLHQVMDKVVDIVLIQSVQIMDKVVVF